MFMFVISLLDFISE